MDFLLISKDVWLEAMVEETIKLNDIALTTHIVG
jgi:hypothetical protein